MLMVLMMGMISSIVGGDASDEFGMNDTYITRAFVSCPCMILVGWEGEVGNKAGRRLGFTVYEYLVCRST